MNTTYELLTNLNAPHPFSKELKIEDYGPELREVRFSFVIPVFNKEQTIEHILQRLNKVVPHESEFSSSITGLATNFFAPHRNQYFRKNHARATGCKCRAERKKSAHQ